MIDLHDSVWSALQSIPKPVAFDSARETAVRHLLESGHPKEAGEFGVWWVRHGQIVVDRLNQGSE